MASRDVGRALLALGEGLQTWAGYSAQKERDAMMAMREENLTRLRASLDAQARTEQQRFLSGENEKDRTARLKADEAERKARAEEADKDRKVRVSEGAADRAVTRERFQREDAQAQDTAVLRQLNAIDERIGTLSDMKAKAGLEGQMSDPTAVAQINDEIRQLQQQRAGLSRERDLMLARRGDPRYAKISPEEAQRLSASPGGAPMPSAAEAPAQRPSAGPAIKSPRQTVPKAPPMDPALANRLQSRGLVPPQQQPAAQGPDMSGIRMPGGPPAIQYPGPAPSIDDIRTDLSTALTLDEAISAIRSGRQPALASLELMKRTPRDRLLQKGLTDQQLSQYGL